MRISDWSSDVCSSDLPAGYSIAWSGQFEYLERAEATLKMVIPMTLALIFVLLFLTFNSAADALLLMLTVPFALVGGFWLIWLLGHAISVATAVGFIALVGRSEEHTSELQSLMRISYA